MVGLNSTRPTKTKADLSRIGAPPGTYSPTQSLYHVTVWSSVNSRTEPFFARAESGSKEEFRPLVRIDVEKSASHHQSQTEIGSAKRFSQHLMSYGRHRSRYASGPLDRSAHLHVDHRRTLGRTIARMCSGRPARPDSSVLRNCACRSLPKPRQWPELGP